MSIYIYSKKEISLKTVFPKNAQFLTDLSKYIPGAEDIIYFDISGLNAADIRKTIVQIKNRFKSVPWGIIDPKGSINDPFELVFDGAWDYLGPLILKNKKKIDGKRFKTALQWRTSLLESETAKTTVQTDSGQKFVLPRSGIKFPEADLFPGWKTLKPGTNMPFFLMYCSLQGKTALSTRLGEKAHALVRQRFMMYLFQNFKEADGLLWMDTGKDFLFLMPPKAKCAEIAVKACIRMLIFTPLSAIEVLDIAIPVNYVFALHYGSVHFQPPGVTGTVVSDAVNFIFHLGSKKAEQGRLTISNEIPDNAIQKQVENCFVSAGEYEGRKIWHTKKFSYSKS